MVCQHCQPWLFTAQEMKDFWRKVKKPVDGFRITNYLVLVLWKTTLHWSKRKNFQTSSVILEPNVGSSPCWQKSKSKWGRPETRSLEPSNGPAETVLSTSISPTVFVGEWWRKVWIPTITFRVPLGTFTNIPTKEILFRCVKVRKTIVSSTYSTILIVLLTTSTSSTEFLWLPRKSNWWRLSFLPSREMSSNLWSSPSRCLRSSGSSSERWRPW